MGKENEPEASKGISEWFFLMRSIGSQRRMSLRPPRAFPSEFPYDTNRKSKENEPEASKGRSEWFKHCEGVQLHIGGRPVPRTDGHQCAPRPLSQCLWEEWPDIDKAPGAIKFQKTHSETNYVGSQRIQKLKNTQENQNHNVFQARGNPKQIFL